MTKARYRIGVWGVGIGMCLSGCGSGPPPLANAHPVPHALASAVLDAVARHDAGTLRSLALNEPEFRELVWPELPASRPERNLPFSYVWGELHQKSDQALGDTMGRHGGRRYTLVGVRFAGDTSRYPSYTVHRETVVQVRDETGALTDLRLFGSTIEKDGAWKVFSYVVD